MPAIENQDLVGITHRFQPVGDQDQGFPLCQRGDRGLEFRFVLRVYTGRGLVQNYDGRILEHGPGDGDTLFLAPGERTAALSQNCVVAIRQSRDEIVAAGGFGGGHHLFMGGRRATKLDVVLHGIVEKIHRLEHHGNVLHQAVQLVLPHIMAAHGDPSALDIPEAGDKITQSGLAAAGGAYHGGGAAGGDCKAHMIQNGPLPIGKRDILKPDRSILWTKFRSVNIHHRRIIDGIGLIHRGTQHLEIVRHIPGALQLRVKHERGNKHQQAPCQRQAPFGIECQGAHGQRHGKYAHCDLPRPHPGDYGAFQPQGLFTAFIHGFLHSLAAVLIQAVSLYHTHALDVLQYRLHQLHLGALAGRPRLEQRPLAQFRNQQIGKNPPDSQQAEPPVYKQDCKTHGQSVEEPADDTDQAAGGVILHISQCGGDYGGNVAQGVVIEVAHGDIAQPVSDMNPLFRHHEIACLCLRIGGPVGAGGPSCHRDQHDADHRPYAQARAGHQDLQGQHQGPELERGEHSSQESHEHRFF